MVSHVNVTCYVHVTDDAAAQIECATLCAVDCFLAHRDLSLMHKLMNTCLDL